MDVEQDRAKVIELARPQFQDGETVVGAFGSLLHDTKEGIEAARKLREQGDLLAGSAGALHPDEPIGQMSQAERMQYNAAARRARKAYQENLPLVVTDRRVFVMASTSQLPATGVAGVVSREQVQVKKVRAAKTKFRGALKRLVGILPWSIELVIKDTPYKLFCDIGYANDLRAVASSFGLTAH